VPSQCLLEFASLLKFVRERIDATSGSGASVPPSPAVTPAGTPAAPTLGRQRSIRDVLGQQSRCVKRCVTPSVLMLFDGQPFLIRCSCLVSLACGRYLLHFNGGTDSYVTVGLTCQLFPSAPPNRSPICFVLLFADTLFPHHTSGEGPGCATPLDRRVLGASRGTRGFCQAQAHPSRRIVKGPRRYFKAWCREVGMAGHPHQSSQWLCNLAGVVHATLGRRNSGRDAGNAPGSDSVKGKVEKRVASKLERAAAAPAPAPSSGKEPAPRVCACVLLCAIVCCVCVSVLCTQ
jgi:hypothetical protein